jgi:hypothetical protein
MAHSWNLKSGLLLMASVEDAKMMGLSVSQKASITPEAVQVFLLLVVNLVGLLDGFDERWFPHLNVDVVWQELIGLIGLSCLSEVLPRTVRLLLRVA